MIAHLLLLRQAGSSLYQVCRKPSGGFKASLWISLGISSSLVGIIVPLSNPSLSLWAMATSKAGLWDVVVEHEPRVLLIDELDKMSATDTAALLSLMEGGRLVRAKKGRTLDVTVPIKVVAATNQVAKLSPELKSRFAIRKLKPYDAAQYRKVVKGVLVRREDVNPELAEAIARKLEGKSQDVRDAVRVARLSSQLSTDKAISLLLS